MTMTAFFVAVLGAIIGSFIGVIVERMHTGQSWFKGRSACSSCNKTLRSYDLIPIVSWIVLKGRCRSCASGIGTRHIIVETVTALLFVLGYLSLGVGYALVAYLVFVSVLIVVVLYDLKHTLVPTNWSLALLLSALSFAVLTQDTTTLIASGVTASCILIFFLAVHFFSHGRAMGLGDAPVAFSLALFAGPYALTGFLFAFWTGAIVGIILLVLRHKGTTMGSEVPFVPYLAFGFLLAYFLAWNLLALY